MCKEEDKHQLVKKAYGAVAARHAIGSGTGQCCCGGPKTGSRTTATDGELGLSCGNPVEDADLQPGEVVVDLGSGAGRDVFRAARVVGPAGKVIGVDMTPQMLVLARHNAEKFVGKTGIANVEFREGVIEKLPLEDGFADVVISNCVINLSPDKAAVFKEIHRTLKPGGRLVVSDIVLRRELSEAARRDEQLYACCIGGAMLKEDYLSTIQQAGFSEIAVLNESYFEPEGLYERSLNADVAGGVVGAALSITVRAIK